MRYKSLIKVLRCFCIRERRKCVSFLRFAEAVDCPEVLWGCFRDKLIPMLDFGCLDGLKIGSFCSFDFIWSG